MRFYFDWDPNKAKTNLKKHKVGFEQASSIFLDPNALTVFDDKHSGSETRWATAGIDKSGNLLVVIHTFQQTDDNSCRIRIISARKATRTEAKQYREVNG